MEKMLKLEYILLLMGAVRDRKSVKAWHFLLLPMYIFPALTQ